MSAIKRKEPTGSEASKGAKRFKPAKESFNGAGAKKSGPATKSFGGRDGIAADKIKEAKTSAEAHAIQRQLAKERKLAKPNAEPTQRAKKLWERLRRKSHVPVEERKTLVAELFSIITGRVKDFVFKHDSVRVIQCALKYGNAAQAKEIARELRGSYRELAESRYAKFLVGKILVVGDEEVRGWVVKEMQGWVRKGIGHAEAGWVLDDMYRGICSPRQKALLLREWYGPEYAISALRGGDVAKSKTTSTAKTADDDDIDANLSNLLEQHPEKRKPTLDYLLSMITSMLNKHMTAFTMLHDAMLQYSLAVGTPSTSALAASFADLLRPDDDDEEDGAHAADLLQNLAFTASGARLLSRTLATSTARDRKKLLQPFRTHVDALARDPHGVKILLSSFECVDDTKLLTKIFVPSLTATKLADHDARSDALLEAAVHPEARVALLYNLAGPHARWLIKPNGPLDAIIQEVIALRSETSKKDPTLRRHELADALLADAGGLVGLIAQRPDELLASSYGCQYISEILLSSPPSTEKNTAMQALASRCAGDPTTDDAHISRNPAAGRMLKTVVGGKRFDSAAGDFVSVTPRVGFGEVLYGVIAPYIVAWACGDSSFVVENMLRDPAFEFLEELRTTLGAAKGEIQAAAEGGNKGASSILEAL